MTIYASFVIWETLIIDHKMKISYQLQWKYREQSNEDLLTAIKKLELKSSRKCKLVSLVFAKSRVEG